ncbi:hypothetical protein EMGBS15_04420 [Filimonas sp.]|nr:hypothetical protein EMGBS15_04420 [Filimonas sp.]
MRNKLSFVLVLVCFQSGMLFAQRSLRFTADTRNTKEAANLMDMSYYQQAYLKLNSYLNNFRHDNKDKQVFDYQSACHNYLLCALKLDKPDAEANLIRFVEETPFTTLRQTGSFELGKYSYEHNRFDAAIRYYEAVGIELLTNQELIQRNFELGYSYLVTGQLDKVEPYFQSAKSIPGEYFKPGNYYHGLLAYYKKNYKEARESFIAVKEDERYKKIIPFYLTEIDYMSGEKEKALTAALQYLRSDDKLYYENELNQMVAQIYCEKEDYANAELYYTHFISKAKSVRDEDYFKLGYCQYAQGKTSDAITHLDMVSKNSVELSQHSKYLLAICYLKTNQKEKAVRSLEKYRALTTDAEQKELVDMALAKLSYEDGDNEQAKIKLQGFLSDYPESVIAGDANELLTYLYTKAQDYTEALSTMKKMNKLNFNLQKVYQKVSYARAISLLKASDTEGAAMDFLETKKFPADRNLVSLSDFWLAECHYRQGKYEEALSDCDFFLNIADTVSMPEYTKRMHLTKAHIYLRDKDSARLIQEYPLATGDTNTTDLFMRMDSVKANYIPEKVPDVTLDPYVAIYELPEEKIDFVYKPIPLKPLALNTEIRREDQTNFVKAGFGNLSSMEVGAGYNFDPLLKFPLYADFNYSTSRGKISYQDVNQLHAGVYSKIEISEHTVDASLEVDRNRLYYYGYDHNLYPKDYPDTKQSFQNIGVYANIKPLHENTAGIDYKTDFYMGLYTDRNTAGEYSVRVDAPISKQLKADVKVQSDVLIDANIYFVKSRDVQGNSLISWRPAVTKQIEKLRIKAGLYPTFGQKVYLLPDVSILYPLSEKYAHLELAWQKHVRLNTFRQLTEANPFLFTYNQVQQSANTEIFAGIRGNALSHISYAFRSGISMIDHLPLFVNDTAFDNKQFNVLYEAQATAFIFDATVDYTLNSDIQAGGSLNLRPVLHLATQQEAWHYVPSKASFYGKVRLMKYLVLKADLIMMAGSKAVLKEASTGKPYVKSIGSGIDLNVFGSIYLS